MLKSKTLVIEMDGRDKGKSFLLTEMAAEQAEAWAFRAFGCMLRAGTNVPPEMMSAGLVGLAATGISALLRSPWEEIKPLFDELFACAQIVVPSGPRSLISSDIEEPMTRLLIRDAVLELHVGFSIASTLKAGLEAATQALASVPVQTSQSSSKSSSPRKRQR